MGKRIRENMRHDLKKCCEASSEKERKKDIDKRNRRGSHKKRRKTVREKIE